VLATGYFHISNTALQMVMLIDDAMAQACHQGEQQQGKARGRGAPTLLACLVGAGLHGVRANSSGSCSVASACACSCFPATQQQGHSRPKQHCR
jgi:hypothetical protein